MKYVNKQHKEVAERCGKEVLYRTGRTFNDGGHWEFWVYKEPDGSYTKVLRPTDYRSDVEVYPVIRREEVVVTYEVQK